MPLVKCPMCDKNISPNASSCPNCGEPMQKASKSSNEILDADIYNILLVSVGNEKIKVIKEIMNFTKCGLVEAKSYIDNVPSQVIKGVDDSKALIIKTSLENIGAKVEVVRGDNDTVAGNEMRCPKCGSSHLTAGNKGFGLGKAAAGGLLLGPVGLLGGFMNSKKVMVTCLKCGTQWQAGN